MKLYGYPLLLILFCCLGPVAGQSQKAFWQDVNESEVSLPLTAEAHFPLTDYRLFALESDAFRGSLKSGRLSVSLPDPEGGSVVLQLESRPVMHPDLAARYPELQSYRATGADGVHGRIAVSPEGIHAILQTPAGTCYIDPYASGQDRYHIAYFRKHLVLDPAEGAAARCGLAGDELQDPLTGMSPAAPAARQKTGAPVNLRVYDLALGCTGEFAQIKGGTKAAVMAAYNAALTRINQIFEQEVAVELRLIANNDTLIWLDPDTDPFFNANQGGALLSQTTPAFASRGVPLQAFDLGHLFTASCTDVGGVVGGRACTQGKARGITCHYTSNVQAIAERVMAHEIAHQFAVGHSWNNCPSSIGQLAPGSAYEPGSGSTIMSYAGSCGSQNIQFDSDDYYHVGSLQEYINYTREGNASGCATLEPTDNTEPMLNVSYNNGFFIPVRTPFELRGTATDAENDNLTYTWEQFDLGPVSEIGNPVGNAPIFRSIPPREMPNRVFPRIESIVNNTSSPTEVLPTYSRDLTFRFVVRDNHPGGGAAVWEEVKFKATEQAGPFVVTGPNTGNEKWKVGEYQAITWDVANTDKLPVNCKSVNILLSTSGGFNYPITLLAGAPNTGIAFVTVPDAITDNARIRVQAADNIFFDISNQDFSITPATEPTYTLDYGPVFQQLCLPASADITFTTSSILDYEGEIALDIVSDLPAGTAASFSRDTLQPGESTQLQLDFENISFDGLLEVVVRAIAPGQDTFLRKVYFDIVDNDFSDLHQLSPVNGEGGINLTTEFTWTLAENAITYELQIATSPTFAPETILEEARNLAGNSYIPDAFFENNRLYYWRIRPTNECGTSDWLTPSVFHTVNATCSPETSKDTPISLPATGPSFTRTSTIFVPFDGVISDVNIPQVDIVYQEVPQLKLTLRSPSGTEVVLYDQTCPNPTQILKIGFDDDAPDAIGCPPDDEKVFQPVEALSAFEGESSMGSWELELQVFETGGGSGAFNDWNIEFCAVGSPVSPVLLTNDTLEVPPGETNIITRDLLEVTDNQTPDEEIWYTVVTAPRHGFLSWAGDSLLVGDRFRQSSVKANNILYTHDGSDTDSDFFTFIVEDNEGGFLPTDTFNILIFEGAVVGTDDPVRAETGFRLFPNPAMAEVTIALGEATSAQLPVRLLNTTGQLLRQEQITKGNRLHRMELTGLPAGLYFIQVGEHTQRVLKQ